MDTVNTELIRGHVDTIILNALLEQDRYGYEILDMISALSEGRYEIKQPTLYSCLKRLEKQGFITSYFGDESQGGRRRYYQLTEKGKSTLEQDQREWEFSRTIINRLLSDKEIDLRTVEAPFNPSELRPLTRRVKVYDDDAAEVDVAAVGEMYQDMVPIVAASTDDIVNATDDAPLLTEPSIKEVVPMVEANDSSAANLHIEETQAAAKPNNTELLRIKEQQSQASRLLGIGEYATPRMLINENGEEIISFNVEAARPTHKFTDASYGYTDDTPRMAENTLGAERSSERLNYRDALSAIYAPKHEEAPQSQVFEKDNDIGLDKGRARHFGDLKQSLYEEGYSLKPYTRANSANYYYMKFIYSNKILRDTSILTYMVLAIEALIIILALDAFAVKLELCVAIAAIGLLIPIIPIVMWALNPTKRIKATFNFGMSITYAVVAFVVISGISLIIALVSPSQNIDFAKGGVYIPVMLAALIPISVSIYGILYRSGNYHLKK